MKPDSSLKMEAIFLFQMWLKEFYRSGFEVWFQIIPLNLAKEKTKQPCQLITEPIVHKIVVYLYFAAEKIQVAKSSNFEIESK